MRSLRFLPASLLAALGILAVTVLPVAAAERAVPQVAAQAAQPADPPESKLTFGLRAAGAKAPDKRPFFSYSLAPGKGVKDFLSVENYSLKPVTLQIYASDAFNTQAGGFDLLPGTQKPTDIGSWVTQLGRPVTIAARAKTILPFAIQVPKGASPGDHAGGIVASFTTQQRDAAGNTVSVDNRVGIRIYLRVAGKLAPALVVENLKVIYDGTLNPFGTGAATVTYTLRNAGNVRLGAQHEVKLGNPFGWSRAVAGFANQDLLLPGNSVQLTGTATGVFPAIQLRAAVRVEPQALFGDINPPLNDVGASKRVWTIPWLLIALVLTVYFVSRELRRRQRRGTRRKGTRAAADRTANAHASGVPRPPVPAPTAPAPTPSRARHRVGSR